MGIKEGFRRTILAAFQDWEKKAEEKRIEVTNNGNAPFDYEVFFNEYEYNKDLVKPHIQFIDNRPAEDAMIAEMNLINTSSTFYIDEFNSFNDFIVDCWQALTDCKGNIEAWKQKVEKLADEKSIKCSIKLYPDNTEYVSQMIKEGNVKNF